jgi:transposase InsO family protein
MQIKSEAPDRFKEYQAEVENQLDRKIKRIRIDGGGEYSSADYLGYLVECRIVKETTAPYNAQQNGLLERCNRTIMDPARSMLKAVGMPNQFWAEVINTTVYIMNLVLTRAMPNTTPFTQWFGRGRKPDMKDLRAFGCLAYEWNPDTTSRKKLDNRAIKTIMIGYGGTDSV